MISILVAIFAFSLHHPAVSYHPPPSSFSNLRLSVFSNPNPFFSSHHLISVAYHPHPCVSSRRLLSVFLIDTSYPPALWIFSPPLPDFDATLLASFILAICLIVLPPVFVTPAIGTVCLLTLSAFVFATIASLIISAISFMIPTSVYAPIAVCDYHIAIYYVFTLTIELSFLIAIDIFFKILILICLLAVSVHLNAFSPTPSSLFFILVLDVVDVHIILFDFTINVSNVYDAIFIAVVMILAFSPLTLGKSFMIIISFIFIPLDDLIAAI
jgi:hypothetical protein